MSKFKVGDKVKVVDIPIGTTDNDVKIGDVGTVLCVGRFGNSLDIYSESFKTSRDKSFIFKEHQVELIKEDNKEDVVNSPKHYNSDPSGVECIEISKKVVSDGGSSDYYKKTIPKKLLNRWNETGYIEAKDVMRLFLNNDFNMSNVFKAYCRVVDFRNGRGKSGIDEKYDLKKAYYFAKDEYDNYDE